MSSTETIILILQSFIERDKFSDSSWRERGLNPSSNDVSNSLNKIINAAATEVLINVRENVGERKIRKVIKSQLKQINKDEYDTEEKEFIADLFHELGKMVNIDVSAELNTWMYGHMITGLMKMKAVLNPVKVVDTISQTCSECNTPLQIKILQKETGIPDLSWMIVQCNNCKGFELMSKGAGVKQMHFDGFQVAEWLNKEEFTREQAELRLEQVRHFRGHR